MDYLKIAVEALDAHAYDSGMRFGFFVPEIKRTYLAPAHAMGLFGADLESKGYIAALLLMSLGRTVESTTPSQIAWDAYESGLSLFYHRARAVREGHSLTMAAIDCMDSLIQLEMDALADVQGS